MIRVVKVADIVDQHVVLASQNSYKVGDVAAILTNLPPHQNPATEKGWTFELLIGEGVGAKRVLIDLPPLLDEAAAPEQPQAIGYPSQIGSQFFYFEAMLFAAERSPLNAEEQEEVALRIKKIYYQHQDELASLRATVANYEAAVAFRQSAPRREPISDDVKLVVWARDGGACIRCGAKRDLHFDHIVPVSKGGGNSKENIQILCQKCNLKKSDKIAF